LKQLFDRIGTTSRLKSTAAVAGGAAAAGDASAANKIVWKPKNPQTTTLKSKRFIFQIAWWEGEAFEAGELLAAMSNIPADFRVRNKVEFAPRMSAACIAQGGPKGEPEP